MLHPSKILAVMAASLCAPLALAAPEPSIYAMANDFGVYLMPATGSHDKPKLLRTFPEMTAPEGMEEEVEVRDLALLGGVFFVLTGDVGTLVSARPDGSGSVEVVEVGRKDESSQNTRLRVHDGALVVLRRDGSVRRLTFDA